MKNRQRALAIVMRLSDMGYKKLTKTQQRRLDQWNRAATNYLNRKYAAEALENCND